MSYCLKNPVISSSAFTPISEEEFHRLDRSVNNLWVILSIAEQLDLVIENYLDLENDLLSMATRIMVFAAPNYEHLAKERNLVVNWRMLNLLNSCRGYLDHTPHHLSSGIKANDAQEGSRYLAEFEKVPAEEYDRRPRTARWMSYAELYAARRFSSCSHLGQGACRRRSRAQDSLCGDTVDRD